MKIFMIMLIVSSVVATCKYGVCDDRLPAPKCIDPTTNPVKIKKCPAGQLCVTGNCAVIPTNVKYDVGEESSDASKCHTGKVLNGYCQGMAKGEPCDASLVKKCDGGLFCNSNSVCEEVVKSGGSCSSTKICAANLLCYPDYTCKPYYSLKVGDGSTNEYFCSTGLVSGGKCVKYLALKSSEWIADTVSEVDACVYEEDKKFSATCVAYSSDQKATGHCRLKTQEAMGISTILAYMKEFKAEYCPPQNPYCAKGWKNIGACPYQNAQKAFYSNALLEEDKYPGCEDKMTKAKIDAIPCSGKSIMLTILSVLVLILLIQRFT